MTIEEMIERLELEIKSKRYEAAELRERKRGYSKSRAAGFVLCAQELELDAEAIEMALSLTLATK